MGKIIRNEKIITPTQYIEKVDETPVKQLIEGGIKEITISDGTRQIKEYAFYNQGDLETINIPSSVTRLGGNLYDGAWRNGTGNCFNGCSKLKNIDLSNITRIIDMSNLFNNCSSLENVIFNDNITHATLDSYAFRNCANLKTVNIPTSIISIGWYAFDRCKLLDIPELSENVASMSYNAFSNCKSLKWKYLPSKITSLSSQAFQNDIGLTQMNFKGDITNINSGVFDGCTNLTKFTFPNNTAVPTLSNINAIPNGADYTGQIAIPNSLYDTWTTATNWVSLTKAQWIRFIDSWDEEITTEGDYALKTDTNLTDVRHLTPAS